MTTPYDIQTTVHSLRRLIANRNHVPRLERLMEQDIVLPAALGVIEYLQAELHESERRVCEQLASRSPSTACGTVASAHRCEIATVHPMLEPKD